MKLVFWKKVIQNILIFVYLLCPKKSRTDFSKTFLTRVCPMPDAWCLTIRWILFVMFYRFEYKTPSFNDMVLVWTAYLKCLYSFKKLYQSTSANKKLIFIYYTLQDFSRKAFICELALLKKFLVKVVKFCETH